MYLYSIYTIIFPIFLLNCECSTDLSQYLTQNRSQQWLKNQTENSESTNPYCSICCMNITMNSIGKNCGRHTMCIYNTDKPGPSCRGFISIHFSGDEITAIVDTHNTIRNTVAMGWEQRGNPGPQPRASNMRVVEWDAELALLANRWAAQCVFAHDSCRDLARFPVGQSIAVGNFALNNDLSFIVDWYDSVDMFDKKEISNYEIKYEKKYPSPSQYAQLVWAETYQIGCARVAFQRANGSNVKYREHFICNYGPSGNIPRQRVYKVGEPCSECPDGTACTVEYPGLCGSEAAYDVVHELRVKKMEQKEDSSAKMHLSDLVGGMYLLTTIFSYSFQLL